MELTKLKYNQKLAFGDEVYLAKQVEHLIAQKDAEIRMLRRALYKACAMWADRTRLICSVFGSDAPKIRWERMLAKCRAMAEKFGEGK